MSNNPQDSTEERVRMTNLLIRVQNFTTHLLKEGTHPLDVSYILAYVSTHMGFCKAQDDRDVIRQVLWGFMDGAKVEKILEEEANMLESPQEVH